MTTTTSRKRRRRITAWLVPTLLLSVGVSWIVIDSLRARSSQAKKYSLPADRSAASMLEFIRRADAEYDPRETLTKDSNLPSINAAIRSAAEAIDADRSALSPEELREADYYRLFYGLRTILSGDRQNHTELNKLLTRTKRFIEESTEVSIKESSVASYSVVALDVTGRTTDALQTADLIEARFSSLPDSPQKSTLLRALIGIRQRLRLLNSELNWTTNLRDGTSLDTNDLRGKVVLVEFWSTTCGPCISDFPALKRIYRDYGNENFEVLSICLYASAAKIRSFTETHELPWLQVCHDSVEGNDEWAEQFEINVVPSTMLVDQSGRVIAFGVRPLHDEKDRDLETRLKQLFQDDETENAAD